MGQNAYKVTDHESMEKHYMDDEENERGKYKNEVFRKTLKIKNP